jgi:putative addiction module component (TIGR02574 family)
MTEEKQNDLPQNDDQIPIPDSHKAELLRRYRLYQADPGRLISLEELKRRIERRRS